MARAEDAGHVWGWCCYDCASAEHRGDLSHPLEVFQEAYLAWADRAPRLWPGCTVYCRDYWACPACGQEGYGLPAVAMHRV